MSYYFTNFCNTCYHCLLYEQFTASIVCNRRVSKLCNQREIEGPLVCEVSKLFKTMASSETEIKLSPIDLRSAFVWLKPQFERSDQLDTQQFLRFIIDFMRKEMNKATKTNGPTIFQSERKFHYCSRFTLYLNLNKLLNI